MAQGVASNYVIEMVFESDDTASGLAKANSWLTLQGKGVDLQTVIGDAFSATVYYSIPPEPAPKVRLPGTTGSIQVTGPGDFASTNGA